VIAIRHNGYKSDAKHPTDLDTSKLSSVSIDPTGKYVVSTRVRTGRSIRGLRLPPTCAKSERREVERVVTTALLSLSGEMQGEYYPLSGSFSFGGKSGGMSKAEEDQMREDHFLFQEPESTLLLSSGMGRHWPDSRGIFANEAKNFLVWCNEEDHTRIISMEMGADLKSVFERFVVAVGKVEEVVKKQGFEFMHNDHLGYIVVSPADLGTGLRASVMMRLPKLSTRADFKQICAGMKLSAVGDGSGSGVFDISNVDRLGVSEVDLANAMIVGCAKLVKMEQAAEEGVPMWDMIPGLGDAPTAGFPWKETPASMPDLSAHQSTVAKVLRAKPKIYDNLKDLKTKKGVTLAACIKTGMDNPMLKTAGMTAGDEESYETFKELFDPVIEACHGGYKPDAVHTTDLDSSLLSTVSIDPTGKYAISTRVRAGRSLRGLRLPPTCTKGERREIERILSKALLGLEGELKGDYYPLAHSTSYIPKPGGMSMAEEQAMRADNLLFKEPELPALLASGMGRNWPDGRGIFANEAKNFLVWANAEDHTRMISIEMGSDIKAVFERFVLGVGTVEELLKKEGYEFMHNGHLGYIAVDPANLGTGLRASVMLKIPLVSGRGDFQSICAALKLQARGGSSGVWDISNLNFLGMSEVELVNVMIEGCAKLVKMEQALENDEAVFEFMPGLGSSASPGFPTDEAPSVMPDLSGYNSIMAEVLRANPKIYGSLKNKKTQKGVTFAACIKQGMDNKGHPMLKTVGMTAGDEESYEVFKELFDPVIEIRHGGYKPDAKHPTDLDASKLSSTFKIRDPTGKYVLSTRIRTGRSLRGLRLPPSCKKGERREVERVMSKALLSLEGDLKGDYFPLAYSQSFPPKMGGMTVQEEDKLRADHLLFQEPDSTLLLSSGMGRHWPDGRGIFVNDATNFLVWVNEEDHMRIISMEVGGDVKSVFQRFVLAVKTCEEIVKKESYEFMHNEHLGYILTSPADLGTGLRASVLVKLPLLSQRADFKSLCGGMRLEARGGAGEGSEASDGVYDISNSDRLGKSEVALVELMINGCTKLIELEQKLERGEAI